MSGEQLDAEFGFEPPYLGRQAGLGDPQSLGRARDAALLGDRDEVAEQARGS
jgi:hypothetical protein